MGELCRELGGGTGVGATGPVTNGVTPASTAVTIAVPAVTTAVEPPPPRSSGRGCRRGSGRDVRCAGGSVLDRVSRVVPRRRPVSNTTGHGRNAQRGRNEEPGSAVPVERTPDGSAIAGVYGSAVNDSWTNGPALVIRPLRACRFSRRGTTVRPGSDDETRTGPGRRRQRRTPAEVAQVSTTACHRPFTRGPRPGRVERHRPGQRWKRNRRMRSIQFCSPAMSRLPRPGSVPIAS